MHPVDATIARLVAETLGLVTRRELLQEGVSRTAIGHRLKAGRLHVLHPGVYSVSAHLAAEQRALAAVLACGPGAVLAGGSAAWLWRMLTAPGGPPEVLRGGPKRDGPAGIRLRRTSTLEATHHRSVPVTTPSRTLLDLAVAGTRDRLEIALNEAQALRLVTHDELRALSNGGRRGSARIRALLVDAPGFTRREAERRLRALLLSAQLPRAYHNVRVLGIEVDAYWPEHRLALEVDGFATHGDRGAFERDREQDSHRQAHGIGTVRVTWRRLTSSPEALVADLAGALALRRPPS